MTQPASGLFMCAIVALGLFANGCEAKNKSAVDLVQIESSGMHRHGSGHNHTSIETNTLLSKLKIFLVDVPCIVLCFISVLVYALLWDLHKLDGWIIIALSASYMLRYVVHTVQHLIGDFAGHDLLPKRAPGLCIAFGKYFV